MEPVTWITLASSVLGKVLGGGGGAPSTSDATATVLSPNDHSAYTVNFGNPRSVGSPSLIGGGAGALPSWVWIAGAAALVVMWKKS